MEGEVRYKEEEEIDRGEKGKKVKEVGKQIVHTKRNTLFILYIR